MKLKSNALNQAIKFALATTTTAGLFMSGSVIAAEESETKVNKNVEKIAVVGSRAAPRSVADSPVPIDIVGGDELSKNGSTDMLDMLQAAVPSFNARQQPISDAASFVRPVNLRGLSSDSTLILLNGKRRHRASVIAFQGGGVNDGAQGPDISVIPSVALKQVEVLRDGAAAQYGSDAIAGVMNFVLKDASEGGSVSIRQGQYYEGDGDQTVVDGNIGLPFTDSGFANLSFQYKTADATSRTLQRPGATALIEAGNDSVATPAQVWGNPELEDDITLFANVGLDISDNSRFYMFGNYSDRTATGGYYYRNPQNRSGVYTDGNGDLLVGAMDGNADACPNIAITSANVLTQDDYINNVANNDNCWAFNELFPGGYTPQFTGEINDTSLTMGTEGEMTGSFLNEALYDISASVGRNKSTYTLVNTVNPSLGADQPLDNSFEAGSYIQLEKALNIDIAKLYDVGLDDPMNVAFGAEWRQESFEIVSGEENSWEQGVLATQGFSVGSHGFAGFSPESQGIYKRQSKAAYLDVEAYLTEDFLVGGALRYEDFSSFGDTVNYKLTAQYSVTDELSLRASHSTGFRAPTVGQANVVNTQTSLVNGELIQSATYSPTHPVSVQKGGVELDPEESQSFAVGGVYQSGDFFLTVDLYHIEVDDRIAQTDKLFITQDDVDSLQGLYPNPELLLGGSITFFANDFDTTTQGADVVANYSMDLLEGSTKFSLAYNYNTTEVVNAGNYTSDFKVKRLEKGIPEHRATLTVAQDWENVSMFVRANYFGEYFATHADEPDIGDTYGWSKTADAAVTFDLEVSYFATDSVTLSIGANNLFDTEAEKLQEVSADGSYGSRAVVGGIYYESGPFDYNGGFYYAKATYTF
ncbi:iron complex outermembrane recepter protein [Pseudoalteromonas espejiana DSM 9414]|uniref:Ligand-gated channel n=1 Tax=Pseudoalteromonas espejiana TaxID=28107 RepID=A0A510Y1J1_9GAMM|nr:TonB-dependent receptor [Pseudoalteromonas espejiana]ASM52089.1 iron complex outermembrane recepter protein [Pseudoalteromonas espejiana DSM 9414]GEK56741.1 ligand-gated channel [Pseudoalteromonas espejiana]